VFARFVPKCLSVRDDAFHRNARRIVRLLARRLDLVAQRRDPGRADHDVLAYYIARRATDPGRMGELAALVERRLDLIAVDALLKLRNSNAVQHGRHPVLVAAATGVAEGCGAACP
jgi:hypothetical protein